MRRSLFILFALVTTPGFAGLSTRQEFAFTPEEGLELTESYEQKMFLELEDMELVVTVNGEEQEQEIGEVEITIASVDHVEFTDEYVSVDGARPTKVRRTYDALSSESNESFTSEEGDSDESESSSESELEGESVVFSWDEDAEEYEAEYDGDGADEDLLDELDVESVLARFLPDGDVDEGDSWEVDVEAFNELSEPGGYLAILEEDEEPNRDFTLQVTENMTGDIEATFQGMREVDGDELAVVHLVLELTSEVSEEQDLEEEGAEGRLTQSYDFEFELEGDLLWNLETGVPHSCELEGDASVTIIANQEFTTPQGDLEIKQTQNFEGALAFTVTVE
jgi:hypothetical protein